MGLDTVELVFEVEEHFGISIPLDEAPKIFTVGELAHCIKSQLLKQDASYLHEVARFLELREIVRELIADPDAEVQPTTSIDIRVPRFRRRKLWEKMRRRGCRHLPELQRPPMLRYPLQEVVLGIVAYGASLMLFNPQIAPLTAILAATAVGTVLAATRPFQFCPPPEVQTFGEPAALWIRPTTNFSPERVDQDLRLIIIKQLGVDEGEVVPSARIVEDLGAS